MSESIMTNVRLKKSEVARIDAAAERTGVSRSDFIRRAIEHELAKLGDTGAVTGVRVRGKAAKATAKYPYPDCPKGPQCQFARTVTGIRVCSTCGVKRS
jgi:predicted DNA-binding protein